MNEGPDSSVPVACMIFVLACLFSNGNLEVLMESLSIAPVFGGVVTLFPIELARLEPFLLGVVLELSEPVVGVAEVEVFELIGVLRFVESRLLEKYWGLPGRCLVKSVNILLLILSLVMVGTGVSQA